MADVVITSSNSDEWKKASVNEPPLTLIEFHAAALDGGVLRYSPRNGGITSEGVFYDEMVVQANIPSGKQNELPTTQIRLSNADRRFMPLLMAKDLSDARLVLKIIRASRPDRIERQYIFSLHNVRATERELIAEYGVPDANRPASRLKLDRITTPGLFTSAFGSDDRR